MDKMGHGTPERTKLSAPGAGWTEAIALEICSWERIS
jgi:hypothetical protein